MHTHILLKNTKDAEEFVNAASKCDFDIDLTSGSVDIDAKSFLGVLTMGTKRIMNVAAQRYDAAFEDSIRKFAVPAL